MKALDEFCDGLVRPCRRGGMLAHLRRLHPEKVWRAVRYGFGWGYETLDGWRAHHVACLAPTYPDDDDTFVTRFYIYKGESEVPEEVFI